MINYYELYPPQIIEAVQVESFCKRLDARMTNSGAKALRYLFLVADFHKTLSEYKEKSQFDNLKRDSNFFSGSDLRGLEIIIEGATLSSQYPNLLECCVFILGYAADSWELPGRQFPDEEIESIIQKINKVPELEIVKFMRAVDDIKDKVFRVQNILTAYNQARLDTLDKSLEVRLEEISHATVTRFESIETEVQNAHARIESTKLSDIGKVFEKVTKTTNLVSCGWLGTTIIIFVGLAVLLASSFVHYLTYFFAYFGYMDHVALSGDQSLESVILKVSCVAVLCLSATWTGRRYAITKKEHTTYRHLTHILSAFPAILKEVKQENAEAVLLETIRAVYPIPDMSVKEKEIPTKTLIQLMNTLISQSIDTSRKPKE